MNELNNKVQKRDNGDSTAPFMWLNKAGHARQLMTMDRMMKHYRQSTNAN